MPDPLTPSMCTPSHLYTMTGQAAANLARCSTINSGWEAHQRLTRAVYQLDPTTHTRARALCLARLALLHLDADDHTTAVDLARQALETMSWTRSARLIRQVVRVRDLWWRCRESNPGPSPPCQGFSERSSLCLCSAPPITRASRCDGPSR